MKTINLDGGYIEFNRRDGRLIAEIVASTPGDKQIKVKVKLRFDCLPYILPRLKKEWEAERDLMQRKIESIDRVLP